MERSGTGKKWDTESLGWKPYYKSTVVVFFILVVIISVITIWNAASLQGAIHEQTKVYVSDVSLQLSDDIDARLENINVDLELLGDSILRLIKPGQEGDVVEFLDRKAEILDFTALAFLTSDKKLYSTGPVESTLQEELESIIDRGSSYAFFSDQGILYAMPVYDGEELAGVVGGVRNRENMQRLISSESFSGRGLTCITDPEGEVVISPTDLDPFLRLEDIFTEEDQDSYETVEDIHRMEEDMKNRQGGVFVFTAVDGSDLVLSYDPLETYDWVLLTLVPADLIANRTDQYISQTFFIIASIIVLFLLILFVLFYTSRRYFHQMERIAFVDGLTGAMNNTAFQIRCKKLIENAPPSTYTIVLLNIKNFKLINEEFDTAAGDETLRWVMEVLCRRVGEGEIAARSEADNFFLCLRESDPETVCRRLKEMVDEINAFCVTGHTLVIEQGAYLIDDPSLEITILQARAKTACYDRQAYQEGQCIFYNVAVTERMKKERELNDLFADSLKNGDFQLYLQPKVRLEGTQAAGAEALVRWIHPQKGLMQPGDFIPLFEANGKICALDLFLFEEVCKTLRRWIEEGRPVLPISVNLSRQHFRKEDCLEPFRALAERYEIPKNLIEMELTESIFFDDSSIAMVKRQIRRMHEMGFRCSLDDFGSGYSSLGLMTEFDVDVIKLDRRFFLDIRAPKARTVIASLVELARKIGVETVAEGIETEEQLQFLRETGCNMVQGYIFSRPCPVKEFEAWADAFSVERHPEE